MVVVVINELPATSATDAVGLLFRKKTEKWITQERQMLFFRLSTKSLLEVVSIKVDWELGNLKKTRKCATRN